MLKALPAIFLSITLCSLCYVGFASALSSTNSDKYTQNNIIFYKPSESSCAPATSTNTFKSAQYSLDDSQIYELSKLAMCENGDCGLTCIRTQASQMVNLFENKKPNNDLFGYLTTTGWYSCNKDEKNKKSSQKPTEDILSTVKDVLVNGNRNLPSYVTEHAYGRKATNDGGETFLSSEPDSPDREQFQRGATIVYDDGSHWTFYDWGNPEEKTGDPFGYDPANLPADGETESGSTLNTYNKNYAGAQVFSDAELQTIEINKSIYQKAANAYGIPWQILAILHSQEHGLQKTNPDNGQGIYQLYSYTNGGTNENAFLPAGEVSDEEFLRQSKITAEIVKNYGFDLSDDDGVKQFFFKYNGRATQYIERAKKMGFSEQEANNGEGSPYVMNRYDAARDPTSNNMDPDWSGRFVADGVYDKSATTNGFGTFVKFKALSGGDDSYCATGDTNMVVCASQTETYESTANGMTFCDYKQSNAAWATLPANGSNSGTMRSRGCMATSFAIAATGFGIQVNPGDFSYSSGGFPTAYAKQAYSDGGLAASSFSKVSPPLTQDVITSAIQSGKVIVVDSTNSRYTKSQHKMALVDVSGDQVYILNPSRTSGWDSIENITTDLKGYYIIEKGS